MKLLNGEIFNAREPLQKLMEKEFPVKVSYGLAKLANKLNDQLKILEDVRQGLVRKYHNEDKSEPMQVKEGTENFEKFQADFTELLNQEVEVIIEKVKLPQEVDGKTIQIEASVLMALEKFVEVE